jgi:hypothetical protein
MTEKKPYINCPVWFVPDSSLDRKMFDNAVPVAAIVTFVHADDLVNLVVFTPTGELVPRTFIPFLSEGVEPQPEVSYAEFIPKEIRHSSTYRELRATAIECEASNKGVAL